MNQVPHPNLTAEQVRHKFDYDKNTGLLTWKDAAIAERLKRITAEQAVKDARKKALEEAIAICRSVCSPYPTDQGDGYNEGALDCEKEIKELLE